MSIQTAMSDALVKAGLSPSLVTFAAACHDLARLALNKQPDPARALPVWLGMASGASFRDGPLKEFLAAVATERAASASSTEARGHPLAVTPAGAAPAPVESNSEAVRDRGTSDNQRLIVSPASEQTSGEGRGQHAIDTQAPHASPTPEPNPADAAGLCADDTHCSIAPASAGPASGGEQGQAKYDSHLLDATPPPETERERRGHVASDNHQALASPPAHRGPTPEQLRAVTEAKERSARVMSGVYISERQGNRVQVDEIAVSGLDYRLKAFGRRAARGAVEYNLLYLINEHAKKQAFIPPRSIVGDIMPAHEIRHFHAMAQAFARSPMIQLPDALRSEIEGAAA